MNIIKKIWRKVKKFLKRDYEWIKIRVNGGK